jgi:hypothetical protein
VVRDEGQAAGGAYGSAVQGGGADAVRLSGLAGVGVGAGEDLDGARDVQALDAVEEDDEDGSVRHVLDSSRVTVWPQ